MNRYYVIDGSMEMNRSEFENWLIDLVNDNELTADEFPSLGTSVTPERSIKHHPLRVAREMGFDVETYTK
jgi:hypothetical protein